MARARSLKPGFFRDRKLLLMSPLGRLMFAGLWTLADREGRLEDDPDQIKIEILPKEKCNVNALLQALADANFIIRYQIGSNRYIQIRTWLEHQHPHNKEPASKIPPMSERKPGQDQGKTGASPGETMSDRALTFNPLPLTSNLQSVLRSVVAVDWPLAAKAAREKFPTATDALLTQLVDVCKREYPPLVDADLADAIIEATAPKQHSAGLYLQTVPQVIKSWTQARNN